MAEGISLESAPDPQPIAEPQPAAPPEPDPQAAAPEPEPEPEGVVEVQGRRMVPVEALSAERRRVREATERAIRERELTPLQRKAQEADQMRAYLQQVQPHLEHLRQHPELLEPPKPTPIEDTISDDEARNEARDLELYAADGQPDIARAKRIIARRRTDALAAAQQAAQAAVGPITSQTAQTISKQQFAQRALRRDVNNQPLVDPRVLAGLWAQLPAELTQHPQVADLVYEAAIGKATLQGQGRVPRPSQTSPISESASGRSGPTFQHSMLTREIAKHAGMSDKAFADAAKTYRPGEVNTLGD